MEPRRVRTVIGGLLVLVGVIFLLETLGVIAFGAALIGALFAMGGLVFLYVYLTNREQWWAVIPGFTLVGLGILIAVAELNADLGVWGGAVFFLFISLAFWVIYLTHRDFWWAVIPGGVLGTLAVVTLVASSGAGELSGALFFLGLAATFGVVSLLPTPGGRQRWALIPAAVMAAMGVFVALAATQALAFVWPAAIIAAGLFLLYRALFARSGGR